jgi:hypothetical protein
VAGPFRYGYLVCRYWAQVNRRLLNLSESLAQAAYLVRNDDIVCQPLKTTKRLFTFLGSVQRTGVDSYHPPVAHGWRWGGDDASDRIKTLKVQPLRKREFTERHLLRVINRSRRTEEI